MQVISAVIAKGNGAPVNVSAVCRHAGVTTKTFYKWLARYRAEGIDGLRERSRRPHRSPGQFAVSVEDAVVSLRKQLAEQGLDHGATTIQWHLGRDCQFTGSVPSVATVHRMLVRRGFVVPAPQKRPRAAWRRFEAAAPNERWQIDAMDWVIGSGGVRVFNVIDDHSRVVVRSRAVREATSEAAWVTFSQAAAAWGLPHGMLSDNGLCFSGKLRHFEVLFESKLRDIGVQPITGRPYHPQTTGKVERFQQTLKKWLRRQRTATSINALQTQLDTFIEIYNHQRPHQGIGRVTPISRWNATPVAPSPNQPLEHPTWPTRSHQVRVKADGTVRVHTTRTFRIHIGARHAGHHATVYIDDHHATVLIDHHLIRHLTLDNTRDYQPSRPPRTPN